MKDYSYPSSLSFWEIKQYLLDIDLLIVGGGIVGLTTAIFFKQKNPKRKVVIVEKGVLPAGASSKNAGFACFGSPSEIFADQKNTSEEHVYSLMEQRLNGLSELRNLVGDNNLNFEPCGGFELFRDDETDLFNECLAFSELANKKLESKIGLKDTYTVADNRIKEFGFSGVKHLILNKHEGAIDTGKMIWHLHRLAVELGVMILNGTEVLSFNDCDDKVEIELSGGIIIEARNIHIAVNGFAKSLLPQLDVQPARAQVLISSPIPELKIKGTFHLEEGFYYFRNVGNRVLFGGGRQLDFQGETSEQLVTTERIQDRLEELLATTILPNTSYKIDHRWSGIMGVGKTKKSIVKRVSNNATCSVRLGGMGVAIGSLVGKEASELVHDKG